MEEAKKVKVLVDAYVRAEPHYNAIRCWHLHKREAERVECRAKSAEAWAASFMEFIRDHRSHDLDGLHVERVYEDQCSECGAKWETDTSEETLRLQCASCGVPVSS